LYKLLIVGWQNTFLLNKKHESVTIRSVAIKNNLREMNKMKFGIGFFQIVSVIISILSFGAAFWLYRWVASQPSSNKRIAEVGNLIRKGANTFLSKEYKTLIRFCSVAAVVILIFLPSPIWNGNIINNIIMAVAYICGTIFSGAAGKVGIRR
jgi:K(+)-stimulated pyrophosphate-energized sodium pump